MYGHLSVKNRNTYSLDGVGKASLDEDSMDCEDENKRYCRLSLK
jgi:hypothetical protein